MYWCSVTSTTLGDEKAVCHIFLRSIACHLALIHHPRHLCTGQNTNTVYYIPFFAISQHNVPRPQPCTQNRGILCANSWIYSYSWTQRCLHSLSPGFMWVLHWHCSSLDSGENGVQLSVINRVHPAGYTASAHTAFLTLPSSWRWSLPD